MDQVRLLLQQAKAFGSQLINFVPRPEFREITAKIRDDITKVHSGLAEKFDLLVRKLTGLERRIESLESTGGENIRQIEDMKSEVRELTDVCNDLREANVSLEAMSRNLTTEIDNLKSGLAEKGKIADRRSYVEQEACHKDNPNGILLWKIEGYQKKRQDAINGVETALYSPPFYSAQYGYKMCAKLYLNGNGAGKGTHLSLFFVVMKGG